MWITTGPALAGSIVTSMSMVGWSRISVENGSASAERAGCALTSIARDHEHRDAEEQLAADRPAQVAHLGVGRAPLRRRVGRPPSRSRPRRSASPVGGRARCAGSMRPSARRPMKTAIFTSRRRP